MLRRENRRNSQSPQRPSRYSGQEEHNKRIQRFQQYLESRGCPVKLAPNDDNNQIRWIG